MALKNSVRHGRGGTREAAALRSVFGPSALSPQRTLKIITAKLFFENGNIDAAPRPSLPLHFSLSSPLSTSEPETDH